jgi:DedD protein
MAQEDKRNDRLDDETSSDDTTQLKKRARRRLIGAAALALLAAVVLPMVMDHQPPPLSKDIQVRIPSPDEGAAQRTPLKPITPRKEEKAVTIDAVVNTPPVIVPEKTVTKPEPDLLLKPESRPDTKPEPAKPEPAPVRSGNEAWEVQLGAYQEPGRVKLLVGKLKELGIPAYTEKVETPSGARTRVRAGPFPSQEAAEKARGRLKIIGVDGPVAKKP